MNEPFDVEISRALKKETAESLQGWEFTPAMQAKVMQRIRAEAASDDSTVDAPPAPPVRRRNLVDWARPLGLVAAAAAAVVLAVNINWSGLGMGGVASKQNAPTTDSAPSAEMARAVPSSTNGEAVTSSEPKQPDVPQVQGATVDPAGSGAPANTGAASFQAPSERSRDVAFALPMPAPVEKQEALADGFTALAAPGTAKMAATPAPEEPADPTDTTVRVEPEMGIAAIAAVENVSGAVADGGSVFTLTTYGLTFTSADMATVRDLSLEGLDAVSIVSVAADGKTAVAGGGSLYLISAEGELKHTLHAEGAIRQVTWSQDGRVAVADGKRVVVYAGDTGEAQFEVAAVAEAELAFTPNGYLAVYTASPEGPHGLVLTDAKGNEVARINQPPESGSGLAVAAGGRVVVAGGHAYSATWDSLWALPMTTTGVTALGAELVVGWDDKSVLNVNVADGSPVWKANWEGTGRITRVVSSPDGQLLAILAETEESPVLWVVESGGNVRLTERLEQTPVEIGLAGNQVVMILPTAVQYRAIPE